MSWIVCQIGAREHYAVARALASQRQLQLMITDFWVPPKSFLGMIPIPKRLRDRWHSNLSDENVAAPNLRMLQFETLERISKGERWNSFMRRNARFQALAIPRLTAHSNQRVGYLEAPTLFAYSYAALKLFKFAKSKGWRTVLGQIDPGPEEERIIKEEHRRNPNWAPSWQPAPQRYWESWREEVKLADRIIVNSRWSKECLIRSGVPAEKMDTIPLVYEGDAAAEDSRPLVLECRAVQHRRLRVLFLGQFSLRKGAARLLKAMQILRDHPIELLLVGPSEVPSAFWSSLPNVSWVGPVPRSRVREYYTSADVFILPTLSDGFALTQLEALSFGTPVISSKYCGDAVIHGVNGWILSDLTPETIASKLRFLLEMFQQGKLPKNVCEKIGVLKLNDLGRLLIAEEPT